MINVDQVVTISIKENKQRQHFTEMELAKLKLKTNFFLTAKDSLNPVRGCFNSHVTVCQQALQQKSRSLLIFEDDIRLLSCKKNQIEKINWFIQQNIIQFDILYLGLIIGKMWFCGLKGIVRAKGSATHAYILSKQGMEKLSNYQFNGTPIDKVLKHDFKSYSVYPIIAEQYPTDVLSSDISTKCKIDAMRNRNFWKNNYLKQKWILWKNLHKTIAMD